MYGLGTLQRYENDAAAPSLCSVFRVGLPTMLTSILNVIRFLSDGDDHRDQIICLLILSVLAPYSPPSGFNDPKSRCVDLVNQCVLSPAALFTTRT